MGVEKKKILKFQRFLINESFDGKELHYYAFDIDDNLFHMPTVIHMERLTDGRWESVDVTTSDFTIVRSQPDYRTHSSSFSEFRDDGPRGNQAFLLDMKLAIRTNSFAPAWNAFKKCLSEGSLFALITARGNQPETYRKAVEYIIDHPNLLTEEEKFLMYSNCLAHAYLFSYGVEYDRIPKGQLSKTPLIKIYLDNCRYYGVSSPAFADEFGTASASNPEKAKEMALEKFIEECNEHGIKIGAKSVSVGFSDDDPKNVEHVKKYFKEKSELSQDLYKHSLKLSVIKTTDRNLPGGEVTKFNPVTDVNAKEVTESSHQATGLESSVMPFTKWNNMTQRLYPSSPDNAKNDYANQMKNQVGYTSDLGKDIFKQFRYKRKKKKKL